MKEMTSIFHRFRARHKIVFVYAPHYEFSGSTVMRGQQLSQIVKSFYGDRYRVEYHPLSTRFKKSTIFLTKGAVTDITKDEITTLLEKNNRVFIDPVDNPLDLDKARAATGIIAASLEAYESYKKTGLPVHLVNHHVDIRLPREPYSEDTLRCGYFGELVNTVITDNISKYVDFIHVDTGKQSNDWLSKPRLYNLHYAVRSDNVLAFKPFLKGFTAAACNANVIIQRDQREAVLWLGKDYPYLLKANSTEAEIIDMLKYAQKTYGGPVWEKALKRMEQIRKATTNETIAKEFIAAIQAP